MNMYAVLQDITKYKWYIRVGEWIINYIVMMQALISAPGHLTKKANNVFLTG